MYGGLAYAAFRKVRPPEEVASLEVLAANLTLLGSIVTLALEDGGELGCGDEVGA